MSTQRNIASSPAGQGGKSNLRLALVLFSVAAVFFIGFVTKVVLFGR